MLIINYKSKKQRDIITDDIEAIATDYLITEEDMQEISLLAQSQPSYTLAMRKDNTTDVLMNTFSIGGNRVIQGGKTLQEEYILTIYRAISGIENLLQQLITQK